MKTFKFVILFALILVLWLVTVAMRPLQTAGPGGMFDPDAFAVNGIQLIALVFGLTQFIKEAFDWSGKKVTFLAAALGVLVMIAYQLIAILPDPYTQILNIVFTSIAFGLAASGYYKFAAERLPKTSDAPQ